MRSAYIAEQNARIDRANALTQSVMAELRRLGFACEIDRQKGEDVIDAIFIKLPARKMNIRAHEITYGAKRGRIDWQGFAHIREHDRSGVPSLGDTQSAPDADPKRIAKQIVARIIEPAKAPIERYNARADEWDAARNALPAQVEIARKAGIKVDDPAPGATDAHFSVSARDMYGSGRLTHEGRVYFDRLSLDPETARCVLEFLANRPKG